MIKTSFDVESCSVEQKRVSLLQVLQGDTHSASYYLK